MTPQLHRLFRAMIVTASLAALGACSRADADQRARILESPEVRRLVGTWDVSFTSDPRASLGLTPTNRTVDGTVVFTTDYHGPRSTNELSDITNEGSYDLDFAPLGFTTHSSDALATCVARVVPSPAREGQVAADSLFIILSPGTERFAVRMAGVLAEDSASGVWDARAHSAGGGAGRFVMRRQGR
jgi:hypothetical protein